MWEAIKGGVQPQPWHHGIISHWATQKGQHLTQCCHCNSAIRMPLYAHRHHWMVLKHFIYIQYGYEKQSKVVCSLDYDFIVSSFHSTVTHRTLLLVWTAGNGNGLLGWIWKIDFCVLTGGPLTVDVLGIQCSPAVAMGGFGAPAPIFGCLLAITSTFLLPLPLEFLWQHCEPLWACRLTPSWVRLA
jgi:hypothetical protein